MRGFSALKSKVISMPAEVYRTFYRFPLSILSAVAFYVLWSLDGHTSLEIDERLLMVLSLGFVLFAAFELILESFEADRLPYRTAAAFVGLGILAACYYYIFIGTSQRDVYVFGLILAGAVFVAAVALDLKSGDRFEINVARIISRLCISALFAIVFILGFLAVLGAVDLLLVDVEGEAYLEVVRIGSSVFFPIMFLKGLPKKGEQAEFPKLIKGLLRFVVVPIMLVFTLVLYLYYIKLVIERSLPISEVGGVSLAFLGIGIPATILITYFDEKMQRIVRKLFPYVLIPVIGVLFLADIRQLSLYGVTITRYLVAAGGIGALISVALMCAKKGRYQRFSLLIAAVLCFISAYGPASAYNLSSQSQSARLEHYLTKNNMLLDGKITPNADISSEDKEEIKSIIRYMNSNDLAKPSYLEEIEGEYEKHLGFSLDYYRSNNTQYFHAEMNLLDISDYDYLIYDVYNKTSAGAYSVDSESDIIAIKRNDEVVAEISKNEVAEEIYSKVDKAARTQRGDALSFVYENEKIKIKLMFSYIDIYADGEKTLYEGGNFMLLLKEK